SPRWLWAAGWLVHRCVRLSASHVLPQGVSERRTRDVSSCGMAMSDAERARRYRDRLRGGPPRTLKPCGTVAAYRRHQRHGEPPCDECRKAEAEHQREMYRIRKAKREQNGK